MPRRPQWTEDDEAALREMFAKGQGREEMAEALGRSLHAVDGRILLLGLRHPKHALFKPRKVGV